MHGIIAAVSPEGVIGTHGTLPWHYPADLKRFKRLTMGTTIVMGRLTYESIGRPLAGRRTVVVTSGNLPGVECFPSLQSALAKLQGDVWFIGGARIFAESMRYADLIDLTYVPDHIEAEGAVYFPEISADEWEAGPLEPLAEDPRLMHRVYRRRAP